MSVIVEFSIPTEHFAFGEAVGMVGRMEIALEAIVPTESGTMPYFWVTGEDFEIFEQHLLNGPHVDSITQLDRIEDTALYRVNWNHSGDTLLHGLVETEAVVLEANNRVGGQWFFRVRFINHDNLGQFYNFCTDHDITIQIERVYTLTDPSAAGREFNLTPEQREAIVLAVQRGYFTVPRETTLSAIGEELGISQQATSKRVRHGVDKVLRASLFAPGERR